MNNDTPTNEYGEVYPIAYDGSGNTCDGTEEWLGDCEHNEGAADHNCSHGEDLYLECSYMLEEEEEELDNGWLDLVQ